MKVDKIKDIDFILCDIPNNIAISVVYTEDSEVPIVINKYKNLDDVTFYRNYIVCADISNIFANHNENQGIKECYFKIIAQYYTQYNNNIKGTKKNKKIKKSFSYYRKLCKIYHTISDNQKSIKVNTDVLKNIHKKYIDKLQIKTYSKIDKQLVKYSIPSKYIEITVSADIFNLLINPSNFEDSIRKNLLKITGVLIQKIRIVKSNQLNIGEYLLCIRGIQFAHGSISTKNLNIKNFEQFIYDLILKYLHEILTLEDIIKMVSILYDEYPDTVTNAMRISNYNQLLKVCRELLHEKIPIIDMFTILESVSDISKLTKYPDIILEYVRKRLFRSITNNFKCDDEAVHIITIKSNIEQDFISKIEDKYGVINLKLSINEINNLIKKTKEFISDIAANGVNTIVMVVDPILRQRISEIFKKFQLNIEVLSHTELDSSAKFIIEGTLEF